jgi:hypothetical protein
MKPGRAIHLVKQSRYRLHTYTPDDYTTTHEAWVVGPHRHTLYFLYGGGHIYRMGLAVNTHVARGQMEMNGC